MPRVGPRGLPGWLAPGCRGQVPAWASRPRNRKSRGSACLRGERAPSQSARPLGLLPRSGSAQAGGQRGPPRTRPAPKAPARAEAGGSHVTPPRRRSLEFPLRRVRVRRSEPGRAEPGRAGPGRACAEVSGPGCETRAEGGPRERRWRGARVVRCNPTDPRLGGSRPSRKGRDRAVYGLGVRAFLLGKLITMCRDGGGGQC